MESKASKGGKNATAPRGGGVWKWVLLALTCVVVGVTVFISQEPERLTPGPEQVEKPHKPLSDQVLAQVAPLMKQGIYAPARDLMVTYVSKFPNDVEVRPVLAEAQMGMGLYDDAEHTIDNALRLSPRTARVQWLKGQLVRRRGGNFITFYRNAAVESVDATPEIWAGYGQALLAEGNETDAAKWLGKAIEGGQKDAATLGAMGQIEMSAGHWERATDLLGGALDQGERNSHLWALLAETHEKCNRPEQALGALARGIKLCPSGELYMAQGTLLLKQNKALEAAGAFALAGRYRDYQLEGPVQAAELYLGQGRVGLAMEQIDLAAGRNPGDEKIVGLRKKIEDARFGPAQ